MVVLVVTLRHQHRLDVLKDARALRDGRRERLRAIYERVSVLASELQRRAAAPGQHQRTLFAPLLEEAPLVRARLGLEGETEVLSALIELLDMTTSMLGDDLRELAAAALEGTPIETPSLQNARRMASSAQVREKVHALESLMRASLEALDKPIQRT